MIDPVTMGLVSGGLNIASGIFGNAAIRKKANQTYNANKLWIDRDYSVTKNDLAFQGSEINAEIGMLLSQSEREGRGAAAVVTVKSADTNVYGNTAKRLQQNIEMQKALTDDNIMQQGEAKMLDLQKSMSKAKYDNDARHVENAQQRSNALSQQKSTFGIIAGGVSAGISGYSSGLSIANAQTSLATQTALLDNAQTAFANRTATYQGLNQ